MYRILLIEDEPPILEMARLVIESVGPDFEVVGTASDGEAGEAAVKELRPDAVITDIQMPILNGLELIQNVKHEYRETEWIILTGHAEFDYAVKALELGVSDYVLKPIVPSQMAAVLDKLRARLNDKREAKVQDILRHCIREGVLRQSDKAFFRDCCYYPLLLVAGNFVPSIVEPVNVGRKLLTEKDLSRLKSDVVPGLRFFGMTEAAASNQRFILLAGDADMPAEELARCCLHLLESDGRREKQLHVLAGERLTDIEGLPAAIQEMLGSAAYRITIGQSEAIAAIGEAPPAIPPGEYNEQCSDLCNAAGFEAMGEKLLAWGQDWKAKGYVQTTVEAILNKLIDHLNMSAGHVMMDSWDIMELMASHCDLEQLLKGFIALVQDVYGADRKAEKAGASEHDDGVSLMQQLKAYMDDHLDQSISYEDLQQRFGYHKDYLAQLFRQKYGMSPNKYLIHARMELGKRLMERRRDLSLKEIALMTGYEDQLYFSKVFKNVEGVSPSKYRERHFEDGGEEAGRD